MQIGNTEWPKWEQIMAPDPVDPEILAGLARNAPLTRPRPGHADLAGMQKYGFDDARPVLERATARETAARVALGTVAQQFLREVLGVEVVSHVVSIGEVDAVDGPLPTPADRDAIDASPVRALHPDSTAAMIAEIEAAKADGDTLGGVVEVLVYGLPPGLGSFVHSDRRFDARLAGALMGIQAMKGVEVGDGFTTARRRGSKAHDEIDPRNPGVTRAVQPGRRHRGRDDQRRGAAGAGGDEADLDGAPRAGHRRRRDRRAGGGDPPAQPTSARCPPPGWWPRRWWPWCSPTR